MLRIIERSPTHVIQKVTKPCGAVIGYQTVALSSVGDSSAIQRHKFLAVAREAAGIKPKGVVSQ